MAIDPLTRARTYVSKMDAAIDGSGGHPATFRVACVLVHGFALDEGQAMEVMREYNGRCLPPWTEGELRHKVKSALGKASEKPRGWLLQGQRLHEGAPSGVVSAPMSRGPVARPPLSMEALERLKTIGGRLGEGIDEEWLRRRSPVDPRGVDACGFLEAIYRPGERVLIFISQFSQGDFLFEPGRGSFRLGKSPEVKAVSSELPVGGPEGVWFLAQPVDGQWRLNPRSGKMSRRSEESVSSWRFFVLENDSAPAELWLAVVAQLALPIVALYTSGGRSIHALVCREYGSKAEWDADAKGLMQVVCPLGADGAALTAVRLTRLPGMRRGDREQRLLWLNPHAEFQEMGSMPEVRE